jgi:ribonuclease BN (tRNA processing enzyme)
MIKIIFGGTSGGIVPTQNIDRGHVLNTCFGIIVGNPGDYTGIIIDNGTGIVNVVPEFQRHQVNRVYVFQTHYHSDHLNGIEANPYLFNESDKLMVFAGPKLEYNSPGKLAIAYLSMIGVKDLTGQTFGRFTIVEEETILEEEGFCRVEPYQQHLQEIKAINLPHPGGCLGYSFKLTDGEITKTIVIATDCELEATGEARKLANFAQEADAIILDCAFINLDWRKGCGHNSPQHVGNFLNMLEDKDSVRSIFLTHLDQKYSKLECKAAYTGCVRLEEDQILAIFSPRDNERVQIW